MSKPRVILDLIDADDCVYNSRYHDLLIWLILKHGTRLKELQQARLHENDSDTHHPEIDAALQQIKAELLNINPCDHHITALLSDLSWNGSKLVDLLLQQGETGVGRNFKLKESNYIDALNSLDKSLLQIIFMKANTPLIDHLMHHPAPHDLHIIGIGSTRQTYQDDLAAMRYNASGLIFQDIFYLAKELRHAMQAQRQHIALHPLTMPDIGSELPRGENYRRIMTNYAGQHEAYLGDKSKLTLLYAMIHDTAQRYPAADITVNFYEDKTKIIDDLVKTFKQYPQLLPRQVTLVIHPYDGKFGSQKTFTGMGPVDENYRHNVKRMLARAYVHKDGSPSNNVNAVKSVNFETFLATRICHDTASRTENSRKSFAALHPVSQDPLLAEFDALIDGDAQTYHLHHRECIRLFHCALPDRTTATLHAAPSPRKSSNTD